jgi:hypothetical protein
MLAAIDAVGITGAARACCAEWIISNADLAMSHRPLRSAHITFQNSCAVVLVFTLCFRIVLILLWNRCRVWYAIIRSARNRCSIHHDMQGLRRE